MELNSKRNSFNQRFKKCTSVKWFVFVLGIFSTSLGALLVKNSEQKKLISQIENESNRTTPVSDKIMETQNQITADRENKLRDINLSPSEIQQQQTTTTTTTTAPAPVPKANATTKTS